MNIFLALHIIARDYADRFKSTFQPGLFLTAIVMLTIGGLLLNQDPPPDDAKFIGIVEAIAQSEIAGISTPVAFLYAALFFLFLSRLVKAISIKINRTPKKEWISDKTADMLLNMFVGFLTVVCAAAAAFFLLSDSYFSFNIAAVSASLAIMFGTFLHLINRDTW